MRLLLPLLLLLSACSATPSRIAYDADLAADQGYQSVTTLLKAHAINAYTAERIVTACDAVTYAANALQICAAANSDDPAKCSTAAVNAAMTDLSLLLPKGGKP